MKVKFTKYLSIIFIIFISCFTNSCNANKKPIVIIAAMESEYSYIEDKISNSKTSVINGFEFISGSYDNYPVILGKSNIGEINASSITSIAIDRFNPHCIINEGTSGAHRPEYKLYDLVIGETIKYFGAVYFTDGDYTKWTYEGLEKESFRYSDKNLVDIASSTKYEDGSLVKGVVLSFDSWNQNAEMINFYAQEDVFNSNCEEMEAYAIANICSLNSVPFLALKVISNNEINDTKFDDKVTISCQKYCLDVVSSIIKTLQSK